MKIVRLGFALAVILASVGAGHAQQTLKVGKVATLPGQATFFADVSQTIAKAANLQVQLLELPFGDLVNGLAEKKIDIAASTLTRTPEREAIADYTQPFASFRDALITSATDTKKYASIADMKGMTLAVTRGAIYIPPLKQAGVNVVEVDTNDAMLAALNSGQVVGAVTAGPTGVFLASTSPKFKIVDSYTAISQSQVSLLVQKGNASLLSTLNAGIAKAKADGTIKALADKAGYGYVP